ncbi:hypothetical protein ENBRE01_1622 [Enteropsectra breve]|nr:hypothetical protein ENBRE01_1622 [Enteropsectra breve]
MLGISGEKKNVPEDTTGISGTNDNIIDMSTPKSNTGRPVFAEQEMSFFQKVLQNLEDYKKEWFKAILAIDIIVLFFFICLIENSFKWVLVIGTIILTSISLKGLFSSKIGVFGINFIAVMLIVIVMAISYGVADDSIINLVYIFTPACIVRIVLGILQLIHACFATPKAKSSDLE